MQVNILGFEIEYKRQATENYFISFDPRMQNEKFQLKIVKIERDEQILLEIQDRYYRANEILNQKIDYLLNLKN
jgi:hypothetical protein